MLYGEYIHLGIGSYGQYLRILLGIYKGAEIMEYRKLISFGKNSFVVSLPKNWVRQNKLVKGDLIYMEESGPALIVSGKENKETNQEKEITINIDGKDDSRIQREIKAAYVLNYRSITIKGADVKKKIKLIQSTFQSLIALEVLEQTADTIVAKDFLNMQKVSVKELIHKMDVVTRAMLREACESFTEETYVNLNERDADVNRLYFLLHRAVLYNLENTMAALKNFQLTPPDLLNYKLLGFYMEGTADEVRRIARYTWQIKLNTKEEKELHKFLQKVEDYYLAVMKVMYSRDTNKAFELAGWKKTLNNELDEIAIRNKNSENYTLAIYRIRRLLSYIHNIVKTVFLSPLTIE